MNSFQSLKNTTNVHVLLGLLSKVHTATLSCPCSFLSFSEFKGTFFFFLFCRGLLRHVVVHEEIHFLQQGRAELKNGTQKCIVYADLLLTGSHECHARGASAVVH